MEKSIWEVILTPLVVAIVGVIGTLLVTDSQIQSSNTLAEAQQKIKIIEIFSDKITEANETERALAIKVLAAVDPDLGQKIASAIADTDLDVTRDIDGMKSSLALEVKAEIKNVAIDSKDQNKKYLVGYYALDVTDSEFTKVLKALGNEGYTIVTHTLLATRTGWLAGESTVLYYSSQSEATATKLADQLTSITGTKFNIKRGAGLGVPKGQEDQRLFVHFVK